MKTFRLSALCVIVCLMLTSCAIAALPTNDDQASRTWDPVPRNVEVYDGYGNKTGRVDHEGVIYDNYGNKQGEIKNDGTIIDRYGNKLGQTRRY